MKLKKFNEFILERESSEFDQVYTQYWDEIVRYLKKWTKDEDKAQEWAQTAFIKAHKNFVKKGDGSMGGWLKSIARNTAFDALRKEKTHGEWGHNMGEVDWDRHDQGEEPEYLQDEEGVQMSEIETAVGELSPAYQKAFKMYYFDNMKHDEIADKLGISVGTSKSNLFKAKRELRKKLGSEITESLFSN